MCVFRFEAGNKKVEGVFGEERLLSTINVMNATIIIIRSKMEFAFFFVFFRNVCRYTKNGQRGTNKKNIECLVSEVLVKNRKQIYYNRANFVEILRFKVCNV